MADNNGLMPMCSATGSNKKDTLYGMRSCRRDSTRKIPERAWASGASRIIISGPKTYLPLEWRVAETMSPSRGHS